MYLTTISPASTAGKAGLSAYHIELEEEENDFEFEFEHKALGVISGWMLLKVLENGNQFIEGSLDSQWKFNSVYKSKLQKGRYLLLLNVFSNQMDEIKLKCRCSGKSKISRICFYDSISQQSFADHYKLIMSHVKHDIEKLEETEATLVARTLDKSRNMFAYDIRSLCSNAALKRRLFVVLRITESKRYGRDAGSTKPGTTTGKYQQVAPKQQTYEEDRKAALAPHDKFEEPLALGTNSEAPIYGCKCFC